MPARHRTPLQILRRKRSDAKRAIATFQRRIAERAASIAKIESEMAALIGHVPAEWTDTHRPRLPRRAKGEVQRAVFDILREQGSVTSADVAARVAALWGLDYADEQIGYALRQRTVQALRRLARGGWLMAGGVGKGQRLKTWAAPSDTRQAGLRRQRRSHP